MWLNSMPTSIGKKKPQLYAVQDESHALLGDMLNFHVIRGGANCSIDYDWLCLNDNIKKI